MAKLHELAKYLYEQETITGDEFMEILNRKPEKIETAAEPAPEAEPAPADVDSARDDSSVQDDDPIQDVDVPDLPD